MNILKMNKSYMVVSNDNMISRCLLIDLLAEFVGPLSAIVNPS